MTVRRAPISTRRLIALVEEDLRPLAEDKALTLTAARAAGLPEFIHADEHMLRRVLVSLVRDRVTLTGRGCVRLDVSLDRDGAAIVFEVSGIGADGASTYTLAIPCEPASPPRADAEAAPSAPDLGPSPVPGDRRATNRHLDRIRCRAARSVLVIDDSIVDSDLIARLLARDDYRVMRASRGEDGLAAAVREKPDLILLDLGMPGMDGFRVIEELKGRVETRDIPVVIHTARNLSAEELTLLPGGARHVFLKNPLDPARILDEIGRLLGSQPIATPSDETLPAGHGRGRILLVEDDAANQYTIGILLRSEGYEVVVASDGFDALARAEAQAPEVILMDMNMPGMGGHQATRALRRMPGTRGIPVIALTAASHAGDREKAIAAGCDDYVSKPIDTGLLLDRIGHWLAARREAPSSEDTALTD